jgi:hypothetical protein
MNQEHSEGNRDRFDTPCSDGKNDTERNQAQEAASSE